MQQHFTVELENLKENIEQMATLVDSQVETAFKALEDSDIELSKLVKVRHREVEAYVALVQTRCENILALFQPVASDLRLIMTALMINNQLERCGEISVNVVQRVKKTMNDRDLLIESGILHMGNAAKGMVSEAITSFIKQDAELAERVIKSDDIVDEENKRIFKFLTERMQADSESVKTGAHLLILSRHIERLGDHAVSIAKDVIFLIQNKVFVKKKISTDIL